MKISAIIKSTPITLETSEGDIELCLTEMSIGDNKRYIKLLKPFLEKDGKVKKDTEMVDLSVAQVMCSLKHPDGQYYFKQDKVEEINVNDYPPGMFTSMIDVLHDLNPVVEPDKTLDTAKKPS